ncbi:hypothetical protein QCD71_06795 [Sphingomonas sp. PsM26]|nr:hypothetical protein [Sphingomonas sp. PsM26]
MITARFTAALLCGLSTAGGRSAIVAATLAAIPIPARRELARAYN